jgi:DNA-binding response OmpR family regulator
MIKKTQKILVVDDEPDVTSYCQSYFGKRGYLVNTTASGNDALVMIKTLKPDLVILDRKIADMSGDDVLRAVREFDQETKIIILTGYSLNSEKEEEEFYRLGISAYVEKPVVLHKLEKVVESIVGKSSDVKIDETKKIFQPEPDLAEDASDVELPSAHKMKNVLGNMRGECEIFLLNKNSGLYGDKSREELEEMSDRIISDTIETLDLAIEVFKKVKKGEH